MNTGRAMLITGAAGGMGALFNARFVVNGVRVTATDMSDEASAELGAAPGGDAGRSTSTAAEAWSKETKEKS